MTALNDRHKIIQVELAAHKLYTKKIDGIWGPFSQKAFNQYKNKPLIPIYTNLNNYESFLWTTKVPAWFRLAWQERVAGVKEIPGHEANPEIIKYGESVSLDIDSDETPWCSSFVNWCVQESDNKGTNSARARSWLNWGFHIERPHFGCVVVLSRGTSPTAGHVGFFVTKDENDVLILGGNQSNSVNISRYPASRVLGYRTLS